MQYKITIKQNPRYIILLIVLFLSFCVNFFLFRLYNNFLLLIISILSIFAFSYMIFYINALFSQKITVFDDHLEYQRSRFETDKIFFREITFIGYFKKDVNNTDNITFGDGIYIYEEKKDNYILIRNGFENYKELFKSIENKSRAFNIKWINIARKGKDSLVLSLKEMLQHKES
ncbi:MAG: hypothetical protein A2086_05735 [Spirochaetes bacterium GWD1_27_9]|nr:MAG: hypothetical protein A2Z98_15600 [Spirochaetes bacterium GWB1_27_13]OHD35278.1 MAG: hypothetical protein A2086_05735 [Spirochaetes bacterium GWD1_27_9]